MKKVFDYFREYYESLFPDGTTNDEVLDGIRFFLDNAGINPDEENNAEKTAMREMGRFKLMPRESFEIFFRSYPARIKVEELRNRCETCAMDRAWNGNLLEVSQYDKMIQEFFDLTMPLLKEQELKSWIMQCEEESSGCLSYAAGKTEQMPESIEERLIFFDK